MGIRDAVAALAAGRPAEPPPFFSWTLSDGTRGAKSLVLKPDGTLAERFLKAGFKPGEKPEETSLGRVPEAEVRSFAAALIAQDFDLIRAPAGAPPRPGAPVAGLGIVSGSDYVNLQVPASQLDRMPALKAIGDAFQRLREQVAG
jgi:hypothetical protein